MDARLTGCGGSENRGTLHEVRRIPLTQGKFALVDNVHYAQLAKVKWCAQFTRGNWYAVRALPRVGGKQTMLQMHRVVLQCPEDVDHRNRNGLDNQRKNLRAATIGQNVSNSRKQTGCTSRYRGVSWNRHRNNWTAQITAKALGGTVRLGGFRSEYQAAKAYDTAARKVFGQFASPNF